VCLVRRIGLGNLGHQSLDLVWEAVLKVEDVATPEQSLFEGPEVEACDNPKIVAATTEGYPEVGVLVGIGVDNLARAEDDLEIDDVIADEAFAAGEEGQAAWKRVG
jgi:hypothetical protein